MKKLLVSVLMALSLVACDKNDNPNNKLVVKIGATLPLTGNLSYIGQGVKNTLGMVLEKWEKQDTKYKYEIVYEDDSLKLQRAATNANKFIAMDKVDVVVSVFGVTDRPVDDIANKNKIISLSCSYGKDVVPEYGINVGSVNKDIYTAALQQLKKDGIKTIAILGTNSEASDALLNYASEHLPKDGIKVVANERYTMGETDYRLSIQKLEESKPDFYLTFGVQPMNSVFVKQYHEITGKNNVASLGALSNIDTNALPKVDGIWSVYLVANNKKFEEEYTQKYNARLEACSANLYDGLDMIITAFEKVPANPDTGIPDNKDVLEYVKNIKQWDGAFGRMNIEQNGVMHAEVPVRVFKGGKWVAFED